MEAFVAAMKLRAAAVNVNFRYVEDELRYLFKDADLVAVVHGPEFDPPFDGPTLEIGDEYEAALAAASPERDFEQRADDDRYILYTGGTTGMPKGVLWRHDDAFFAMFGGGNYAFDPVQSPEELAETARNAFDFTFLIVPPLTIWLRRIGSRTDGRASRSRWSSLRSVSGLCSSVSCRSWCRSRSRARRAACKG